MNLDSLQLFVSVATHRSFSRAAQEHGLHRSAVSRRITALEQELGVDLLIRTTRRVEPTTAGRRLLDEVSPLLERVERAVERLPEAAEEPAGALRISAPQDVGMWLLPEVLGALACAYPGIRPSVVLSNRLVDLEREGFDVALRISRTRLSGANVRARRLGSVRVGLFAAPEYLERHTPPTSLAELGEHRVVGLDEVIPSEVEDVAEALVSAGDMLLAAALARHGVGLAFLSNFVAAADVASGALVPVMGSEAWEVLADLYLVFPNATRLPSKSIAFRDEVVRFIAQNPLA